MGLMSGAAIAGIASAGAALLGQNSANKTNEQIANNANATQIDLANTAYQRRVKDLSAAGLNPMLAYQQGGAAVPQMNVARVENALGPAVQSGAQAYSAVKQGELIQSQIDTQKTNQLLNTALSSKALADADASTASAAEARARTPIYASQIREIAARVDNYASQTGLNFAETTLVKKKVILAMLEGGQIEANTANTEMNTVLQKVRRDLEVNNLRMSDVSANAAESPLGRYIMPFLPFGNSTAGAVAAGSNAERSWFKK